MTLSKQSAQIAQIGLCPSYLSELFNKKVYPSSLRSADGHSLVIPLFKLRAVSDRSWAQLDLDCGMTCQSLRDGLQVRADPRTALSALLRSYLKSAYYYGL